MRGTTLIYKNNDFNYNLSNEKEVDIIRKNKLIIYKNFNKKFDKEKIFAENENLIIALDGVILNNSNLYSKYNVNNNLSLISKMYDENGIRFIDELRGNFYGLIYDKNEDKVFSFTNHLGNKPLYYYHDEDYFVSSSDLFDLVKSLKNLGIKVNLDEVGAYYMLTFGYMITDTTMIKEIKKVDPGTIVSYKNGKINKEQYFFIDNENYLNDSEEKIMANMNELFRNSIDLAFKKDIENGYKHLAYLSGGLDSRMISIVAKDLGYNDITTITFSENYSRDEKIARKIAADFKLNNIFRSLNNGLFLMDVDKAIEANFGQIIYSGAAHLVSTNDIIDFENFGFIYNGNLADVMHGDYIEGKNHSKPSIENWMYSKKLIDKVKHIQPIIADKYGNEEKFAIYNRGINGIYNGSISALDISETCEPFTNQDLIAYCTRMKPEYKYKEALFLKMIQKYYPEATKYKWQKWNLRPTKFNTKFMGTFAGKVFRVIDGQIQYYFSQSNNMNPFDKWYSENPELRKFINDNIKENLYNLDNYKEIKSDCEYILNNGSLVEKTQVITLLNFIKRINEIYG